jgi:hypothetical protein
MVDSGGVFRSPAVGRSLTWVAGFGLASALLFWRARAVIPVDKVSHDHICYWAAGVNLVEGRNPYDAEAQARVHQAYGWDKTKL